MPTVYVAADHAGFERKEALKARLVAAGYQVDDLGAASLQPDDDYPQYAFALAERVAREPAAYGVLLCGNGQGVCIAANKIAGVRAATAVNPDMARSTRNDDDANVLCLPARFLSDDQAFEVARTWLDTPFSDEERHRRRLEQLAARDHA